MKPLNRQQALDLLDLKLQTGFTHVRVGMSGGVPFASVYTGGVGSTPMSWSSFKAMLRRGELREVEPGVWVKA